MFVFVASHPDDSSRLTQPFDGVERELVRPSLQCPDPFCGCGDSFTGMSSGRLVKYARVVERDQIDPAMFRSAFLASLVDDAGIQVGPASRRWASRWSQTLTRVATAFGTGTLVAYDGNQVNAVVAA